MDSPSINIHVRDENLNKAAPGTKTIGRENEDGMRLNIPYFSKLSSLASLVAKEIDPSPELISIRVRKNQPNQPVFNFDFFTVKVNMDGNSGNIPLPKDAEIRFFFFGKLDRTEVWGAEKILRLMEEAKRQKATTKNPR